MFIRYEFLDTSYLKMFYEMLQELWLNKNKIYGLQTSKIDKKYSENLIPTGKNRIKAPARQNKHKK